MGIKVSELIIKATTKCKKGFSCLSDKTDCMCKAISSSPDHTVVIKPSSSDPCNYHRTLGNAHYCLCPVRNDIYNRYKI
jgi:hypothetical protein